MIAPLPWFIEEHSNGVCTILDRYRDTVAVVFRRKDAEAIWRWSQKAEGRMDDGDDQAR